ncbi:DUF6098 family protein [Agromyces ramosus]|uniref:Uncharacterized protein n=1 Tax=Agromyces ramosus TaxID=33879 RepID=A0ABU0RCP1_9MICO|nr:DUF6098 family protein [Agromyces ramosus]MDQ0895834.1 hypothetical protein [Agromyces ramosus]
MFERSGACTCAIPRASSTTSTNRASTSRAASSFPGLSANPLDPQPWWTRPLGDWLARQLCQYKHLRERNPDRIAWVLRGRIVARGPDDEPLLRDVEPIARLSAGLLDEAERRYEANFAAGLGPEGPED